MIDRNELQSVWRRALASGAGALCAFAFSPAYAQIVADQNLAGASIVERNGCAVLRIDFYSRVQLRSYFPQASGEELRLNLELLDRPSVEGDKPSAGSGDGKTTVTRREQTRVPPSERAAVGSIELESTGPEQVLNIYFRHAVAFRVAPAKDARTLLVAISGRTPSADCKPEIEESAVAASSVPKTIGKPSLTAADTDIADARTAMGKADYDRAIALLTRVTEAGGSKRQAEAVELLGVAQEQKGHLAHARAEYQNYLKQFPKGEGFARVQQRLAALDKRELMKQLPAPVPAPAGVLAAGEKLQAKSILSSGAPVQTGWRSTISAEAAPAAAPPDSWTFQQYGSLSSYYNLNQGGRDFFVRPNLQNGWDKETVNRVYRNSILSMGDYESLASNPFYEARLHVSASHEKRFTEYDDEARISTFTLEGKHKETGSSLRIGRQTHYGGGVLGRFDGGLLTVPFADAWKMRLYGGGPVERADDRPFLFDRAFYGGSVEYSLSKKFDVGAFAIEQSTGDFLERRAVGAEARYIDEKGYVFGSVDYDLYFGELNSFMSSGTLNFDDRSSLTAMIDYRRSPTLFVSNALQGQVETSLQDLLGRYTTGEIESLARDRTPISTFASISYSRYVQEKLQITGEISVANMSSMPESGGVPATPSTGWDTYSMLQIMATDVFRENDSVIGTVRYATTQSADRTMLEGTVRVPMGEPSWIVSPSIRLGFADYKLEPTQEYIIHPMLRTSYNYAQNIQLEFEVGKRWTTRETTRGQEGETDLLVLGGLRYDFNSGR